MVEQGKNEVPKDSPSPAVLPAMKACPQCNLRLAQSVDQCPQCGTALVKPIEEDASFRHKYEFLATIGSGGMGVIYKARLIALDKLVAIKMLHSHMASDDAIRRFQIEGKAASLLHHKYIIDVHDFGSTESGRPFMVMDYLEGTTLAQELADHGPLKVDRCLRIFLQVCDALSHAHGKEVLHRDLKPSNIMLLTTGGGAEEVRLMDFGIAKLMGVTDGDSPHLTKTGEALGSPLYMSPEQCRSADVDKRSDLYSLGCVMYEALTGAPPFIGKSSLETIMRHLDTEPLPLSQASLGTTFDAGLEDIISRLLKKDSGARYQSIEELESDLIKFQDATVGGKQLRFTCESVPPQKYEKRERALIWVICALAVPILVGTIALVVAIKGTKPAETLPEHIPTEVADKIYITEVGKELEQPSQLIANLVMKHSPIINLTPAVQVSGVIIHDHDLAPLVNATNTNTIVLPDSPITDNGLVYIEKLQLKSLSLHSTKVRSLGPLRKMTTIESLDLTGTDVDGSGVQVISQLKNLKQLSLAKTGIWDRDLPQLRKLTHLQYLSLSDCSHVTETAVNRLRQEMKQCKIVTMKEADIVEAGGQALLLAKAAMANKDWVNAESNLRALINQQKLAPGFLNYEGVARWQEMFGQCEDQLDNYDSAISSYNEAASGIARRKDLREMLSRLCTEKAQAYERNNDDPQANPKIENALQKAIEEREHAARIFAAIQQPDLKSLYNLNWLARDHCGLHQDEIGAGIIKSALPEYEKWKTRAPGQYAVALHILANADARLNKLDDAVKVYHQCVEIYAKNPKWIDLEQIVRCNLASAYLTMHKYSDAEVELKKALDSPGTSDKVRKDLYEVMAQCLQLQKKDAQAKHYQDLAAALKAKIILAR